VVATAVAAAEAAVVVEGPADGTKPLP